MFVAFWYLLFIPLLQITLIFSFSPLEFRILFPQFTGVLTLAFFIHNCVITLLQNNKNQENNVSDFVRNCWFVAIDARVYIFLSILFLKLIWVLQQVQNTQISYSLIIVSESIMFAVCQCIMVMFINNSGVILA